MIKKEDPESTVTIATSANQIPQIKVQLRKNGGISVEPTRRDAFPAFALTVAFLSSRPAQ